MQVTRLRIYPVKSFAGLDVPQALVEPWGLAADRRWCMVDDAGDVVTAREVHGLLGLSATPAAGGSLEIRDNDGGHLAVSAPREASATQISMSRQPTALPAPDAANAWLSERIGTTVRLVWQPDPMVRSVDPEEGGHAGETLSLADAGPIMLLSLASLAQLDEWTPHETEPMDPVRFRPNVIIDGALPFAEDDWSRLRIGAVGFRTTTTCDRCVMTTLDPQTFHGGKEPIATLARHRRWDGNVWFGTWLAPEGPGTIGVGDSVVPI